MNWITGRGGIELSDLEDNGDVQETDLNFRDGNGFSSHARFTVLKIEFKPSVILKFRKASCYSKQKIQKNVTKLAGQAQGRQGRKTLADRIGIKPKRKDGEYNENQSEDFILDNLEEQEMVVKEDEMVYYRARKLVPRQELKLGMERLEAFNFCEPF